MPDRGAFPTGRAVRGAYGVGTSLAGAPAPASWVAPGNEYWVHGTTAVVVLFALVVVRVHELFPYLFAPLRPAWTITIPLAFLLFRHSSKRVVAAAFAYLQTRLLLAFLGVAALTIPFAIWPGEAFSTCKGLLPSVLVFLGCMLVRPGRATLDRVQLAFVGLVLFFAAYQNIFAQSWAGRLRPLGGSYDGNDTAALMALSFPLAAGLLVRAHRGWPRVLASLAVVALVVIVVATGSRGGTLALLAGALAFALPMRGARGLIVWTGMIGGGVLAWTQATPDFRARMVSLTNLEQDYNYTSDSGRKAVWARGRAYWRANPILGVGAGNFGVAEGEYNAETGRTGKWSAAHNAYIQALAELGTFGGGLFIAMLLVGAASAFPLWRGGGPSTRGPPRLHRPELLASLAASASAAYFLSHAYFSPLYGVLALIALADRTAKAEASGGGSAVEPVGVAGTFRLPGQRGGLALVRFSSRPMMRGGVD